MEKKALVWLLVAATLFVTWLIVVGPQAAVVLSHLF